MSENSSGRDFLEQNLERLLPAHLPRVPQSELDATRDQVCQRTLLRLRRRTKLRRVFNVGVRAAALAAVFVIGVAVGRARPAASGHPAEKSAGRVAEKGRPEPVEQDPMKRRFQIADAMAQRGESSRAALEYVAMAVKYPERPESVQAYRRAGDLFLEADDIESATHAYREFIKRSRVSPGTPESGELVSHGGWLLAALASDPNAQRRTEQ
jgi:TolA-binding protein